MSLQAASYRRNTTLIGHFYTTDQSPPKTRPRDTHTSRVSTDTQTPIREKYPGRWRGRGRARRVTPAVGAGARI